MKPLYDSTKEISLNAPNGWGGGTQHLSRGQREAGFMVPEMLGAWICS